MLRAALQVFWEARRTSVLLLLHMAPLYPPFALLLLMLLLFLSRFLVLRAGLDKGDDDGDREVATATSPAEAVKSPMVAFVEEDKDDSLVVVVPACSWLPAGALLSPFAILAVHRAAILATDVLLFARRRCSISRMLCALES